MKNCEDKDSNGKRLFSMFFDVFPSSQAVDEVVDEVVDDELITN